MLCVQFCFHFPMSLRAPLSHAAMYFGVERYSKGGAAAHNSHDQFVEGGIVTRPPWLNWAVHVFNSLYALFDVLISEDRTFSTRSAMLCLGFCVVYPFWLLVFKKVSKDYT